MLKQAEVLLILLVLAASAFIRIHWPTTMGTGQLVLIMALVFLVHTLLRDIALLAFYHTDNPTVANPRKEVQCFCLESGIGMTLVALGILLFTSFTATEVALTKTTWLLLLGTLMATNYMLRDYVFSWNPWRIYRDHDHLNIIPRLRASNRKVAK